ncbi:MAG: sigma 54-interacting transcriptional regulator [Nitrospira sp.]|nr:sigma 54-interacting transcriptional regulator [Nitrospira sp.]
MNDHGNLQTHELEIVRHRALLEVSKAIAAHRDLHDLFHDLAQRLPQVVEVNFVALSLHDPERNRMRLHTLQANIPAEIVGGHEEPVEETPAGFVWQTQQPLSVPELEEERRWPEVTARMQEDGIRSLCIVPLTTALRRLGTMGFASVQRQAYGDIDVEFLQQVGKQVAVAVDNVLHHQDLTHDRDRLRLLLEVSESIASHRDLDELLRDLAQRLPHIVPFDYINLVLHDPARDVMRLCFLVTSEPSTLSPGLESPVSESPGGLVWQTQEPLIVNDIAQEPRFPALMSMLRDNGVQSFCVVPLTTAQRRLGAMGFGSLQPRIYQPAELDFMHQVAKQVAVAVDNALNAEAARAAQAQLAHQRDRQRMLLEVNNAVVSHLDLSEVFTAVSECLRKVIRHDDSSLVLYDCETQRCRVHVLHVTENRSFTEERDVDALVPSPSGIAITTRLPAVFREQDLEALSSTSPIAKYLLAEGVKSLCCVPLLSRNQAFGALNVGRQRDDAFTQEDVELLNQVAQQIAIAVENGLAYREIADLKEKLSKEKLYLEEEIKTEYDFEDIVGHSAALRRVLKQVEIVAPTDSTVLILGETGTGKELLARAIHDRSSRRERTLVKMNCAAIPTGLLESELFGHERGAFTGAIAQKVGRFELADGGTLFLDEVGDIPLELQSKLLRVLQEQEFERLGGTRTIKVNIRLLAATNRNLVRMVAEKEFRNDLYYRLNVFPLTIPALRDRREDIPSLVRYFAQKFARRMKKTIDSISTEGMSALAQYDWPGNVRELENVIERATILSQGGELQVALEKITPKLGMETHPESTLEAAERAHIVRALQAANWIIGGPHGAAAKLGMKRTTLQSRMLKLSIARPS